MKGEDQVIRKPVTRTLSVIAISVWYDEPTAKRWQRAQIRTLPTGQFCGRLLLARGHFYATASRRLRDGVEFFAFLRQRQELVH